MERIPAPRRSGRGILGAGEAGGPSIGGLFFVGVVVAAFGRGG